MALDKGGRTLAASPEDQETANAASRWMDQGVLQVELFFGESYRAPFGVRFFPDRDRLDRFWRESWKQPDFASECWMVASGDAKGVAMLSPRVWATQACDHPAGEDHARTVLVHELVHVYHAQRNPRPDFEGMEGITWFVEGLAVLASGQPAHQHAGRAREAVERGEAPQRLAAAWSGPYRYAVCGSLVEYVHSRVGTEGIQSMLAATTEQELLARVGLSETRLLERWKSWLLGNAAARPTTYRGRAS